MPKYVCDIETVRKRGKEIEGFSDELLDELVKLSKAGKDHLSSANWTGDAKDSFAVTYKKVGSYAGGNAYYLKSLGQYIQAVADGIEEIENNLGSIDF